MPRCGPALLAHGGEGLGRAGRKPLVANEQFQLSDEAAERYERCPARYILGPWAPLLVDVARVAAGEGVLDVACGTGVVTRIAAERAGPAGRVVGVDLNAGMIRVARSLPPPIGAPIEWLERSALDLGLKDASFDVVLCQQGLQFFPDKALALREMRRVLGHGGRLAVSVWTGVGAYHEAVGDALVRFISAESAARFRASRQVPTKEDLQRLATQAGFSDVEVRVHTLDIHLPRIDEFTLEHLPGTPVADNLARAAPEAREKIAASVMKQLEPYADGDGVTYPEETHVLTARVR
jgi:ubiquinone/menaquinone biosynthesis C-methylase UbiE